MKKLLSLLLCLLLMATTLTACVTMKSDTIHSQQESSNLTNSHDGHDHATPTSAISGDKVSYQVYINADKTYRLVFRDAKGKQVADFDKIAYAPTKEAINADEGIYEVGWASGSGPNDYYCVYYNIRTGEVSQLFHAPRGTDGVRIAYGSEDQTKVVVRDVFASGSFYKEYPLENAYTAAKDIIVGGSLKADKKTVLISYIVDKDGTSQHITVNLYE